MAEIVLTLDQQWKTSGVTLRRVQSTEVTRTGLISAHVQNLVQVERIFGHATAQIRDPKQVDWIVLVWDLQGRWSIVTQNPAL